MSLPLILGILEQSVILRWRSRPFQTAEAIGEVGAASDGSDGADVIARSCTGVIVLGRTVQWRS